LAQALLKHRDAFHNKNISEILNACEAIRISNIELDDPLRYVTKNLGLPNLDELMWLGIHATETEEAMGLGEENLEEFREAARNRIKV